MEYIPKLIPHLMLFSLSSSKICTVDFHSNDNSLVSDYGHILVCLKLTNSCDLSYVKYSVPPLDTIIYLLLRFLKPC